LLVGLYAAGPSAAASWADALFDELSRDFGSVPRGPTLQHAYHLKNTTGVPVHIAGVRVSCGCTTAWALQSSLQPGEETAVVASMDTRRFSGVKTVTIYVTFDQPRYEEVRLWIQANGRDDVNVTPDALAFGQARRGTAPTASVRVSLLGSGQYQVLNAKSETNYIQTSLKELARSDAGVTYELTAKVRPDSPVGKWYTDVWLTTNHPSMPKVRVPLTVEVSSPLTVNPSPVTLGGVKAGTAAERRVIVRGVEPFRVTAVKGTDDQLSVQDNTDEPKPVHVLTVKVKAEKPGEWSRTLRVITDLKEDAEIDFQAHVQVVP
jgi:hypothetical protein